MTERETLFLRTGEDMRARIDSPDPYEILGISVLLRELLLDAEPLVDQINQSYRLKIKYHIGESDTPNNRALLAMKPASWSFQDGLDPETAPPHVPRLEVDLDKLLATKMLLAKGKMYSVKDIILFEANLMGGVHTGSPASEKEKALQAINKIYVGGDARVQLRQLLSIARVVDRALDPLYSAVRAAGR